MIALAILGLLVGLAVMDFGKTWIDAENQTVHLFVGDAIRAPLTAYRIQMGDYPSTAEGLQALVTAPSGQADRWRGPYIDDPKKLIDPWNQPYVYRYPGTKNRNGYDLLSKGPDRVEGTADDISNF